VPELFGDHRVAITLVLLALLGAVFLRGFKEAIGLAVLLVAAYLLLNLVVVAAGFYEIVVYPQTLDSWQSVLLTNYGSPQSMIAASLVAFPLLALGLSGFETGVSMMPLVRGERQTGRIAPPAASATHARC
jgi:lysylphosphatidylglycerol synthetase-like protein (DUF2156 family)